MNISTLLLLLLCAGAGCSSFSSRSPQSAVTQNARPGLPNVGTFCDVYLDLSTNVAGPNRIVAINTMGDVHHLFIGSYNAASHSFLPEARLNTTMTPDAISRLLAATQTDRKLAIILAYYGSPRFLRSAGIPQTVHGYYDNVIHALTEAGFDVSEISDRLLDWPPYPATRE
jgi:hypothetical protein